MTSAVSAQQPATTAHPASTAHPAAQKDVVMPLEERNHSGVHGNVTLHPQGNQTWINVSMFSGPEHLRPKLELHPGADCNGAAMSSRPIVLNPINTGQTSKTFVSVPLESFKGKDFVVAVRDSTTRQQAVEACAHLRR
jgi:hypothetical protein